LNITYFTISASDPDAGTLCCGVSDNEVQSLLGPDGMPVLNTGMTGAPVPTDVNSGTGELTYWDPSLNSHVTQTGTAVVDIPFINDSFFAPNGTGTCDGSAPGCYGFQSAILSGTIDVPTTETISFNVLSDDNAFVYLDGTNVCDDGGVHGAASTPCTTSTISAGDHTIEVFYDDLDPTAAELEFYITTEGVTTSPPPSTGVTPEPGSFVLLSSGLAVILFTMRRKFARAA
jgi:hypothetical protein